MLDTVQVVKTFPSIHIPSQTSGPGIDVSLIAQLGHGAGNHLFASVASRQRQHAAFIDELDEPSAKLANADFEKGDHTSLYSFMVGPKGHPFHRHAGHRIFTAVSGSGGAQLRFSTASEQQIKEDPKNFVRALTFVNIPPDCLFTVRFGSEIWHQFWPLSPGSLHPVFFALSAHTDELGGNLSVKDKAMIVAGNANIPSLTELLPPEVENIMMDSSFDIKSVPTTMLSLDAPDGTLHRLVCNTVRGSVGILRGAWGTWKNASGFLSRSKPERYVEELDHLPEDSLLQTHLSDVPLHHEDTFCLTLKNASHAQMTSKELLAQILHGFLLNAPGNVSKLMFIRNMLVKPLGLRTSPLGCPVSSLLSPRVDNLFANQFPVLDQNVNDDDTHAQVILGANDKHLLFRSCVSVKIIDQSRVDIMLGTRVHCINNFGKFYMAMIDYVHRRYVTPTMLRRAVDYAMGG